MYIAGKSPHPLLLFLNFLDPQNYTFTVNAVVIISNDWQFMNLQGKTRQNCRQYYACNNHPVRLLKLQGLVGGGASEALELSLVTALN